MSKQRAILPGIVAELSANAPSCGVLLMGSVRDGDERPESDVDLYVIVAPAKSLSLPDGHVIHEEKGMKLIERFVEGVKVHFVWWRADAFRRNLDASPHSAYPFAQAEILHDPAGIANHCQAVSLAYFDQHPELQRAWEEQLDKLRQHKHDPTVPLGFPEWGDFAEHLEQTLACPRQQKAGDQDAE